MFDGDRRSYGRYVEKVAVSSFVFGLSGDSQRQALFAASSFVFGLSRI
jgi:hypothetical protein